eukprot:scaffold21206_cov112-Isochrysis_galbana.AAC.1
MILKYDKGTHDQTQAHRGIQSRESGGGPGDGGVGHLLAGPYSGSGELSMGNPNTVHAAGSSLLGLFKKKPPRARG